MGIDPEELKRLVQDHDVDPDYNIQQALDAAGSLYSILSWMPKNQGAQKNQLSRLAKKAHRLVDAINEFEDVRSGFDSFPTSTADPVRLSRCDPTIQQFTDNWNLYVKKLRGLVQKDAGVWATSADHALAGIGRLKPGGGDPTFNTLIYELIDVFVVSTGKEPTYPSTDLCGGRGGLMFQFICDCLDLLRIGKKTNQALGSVIDRILDRRKQ
jgi:hypothetical protein